MGSGVPVELIEVDNSGAKVGVAIASTTTDASGNYSLTIPPSASFTAGTQYVVRIGNNAATQMDVRVTAAQATTASDPNVTNALDVDPVTDATSELVSTLPNNTTEVSLAEVVDITDEVNNIAQGVDTSSTTTDALVNNIKTDAGNDEEVSAMVQNSAAAGQVCGNVKDAGSNDLENIRIMLRDSVDFLKVAKTRTDVSGNYCVNVTDGNYVVGAINRTNTSFAAGEYWTSGGGADVQYSGETITVSAGSVTAPVAAANGVDFVLDDGVRIEGNVTSAAAFTTGGGRIWNVGDPIERVVVELRKYRDNFPVGRARVKTNGSYRINVKPGIYRIGVRNRTRKPFASEFWVTDSTSTANGNLAMPLDLSAAANTTVTENMDLDRGRRISGLTLDAPGGSAVGGQRIDINPNGGGFGPRLRSNKVGFYRVVVAPGVYSVNARGQSQAIDVSGSHAENTDFDAVVQAIPVTVQDASGNPVSQAKVSGLDANGGTPTYSAVHKGVTNSNGQTTLYVPTAGDGIIEVKVDSARSVGSIIYDDSVTRDTGTRGTVATIDGGTEAAVTVALPTANDLNRGAGVLEGTYTESGTGVGNVSIQVRPSGSTNWGGQRLIAQRTRGDGTYTLTLPGGTYDIRFNGGGGVVNSGVVVPTDGTSVTSNGVN